MSQPNKARALCGKLVPEPKLAFHQATCQKCKAIRGVEPKPEYRHPVEAASIPTPPPEPEAEEPDMTTPEPSAGNAEPAPAAPPVAEAEGATSSPSASNPSPEPQSVDLDALVKMVADRVAGMVLPAMDTLARRIDAIDGGPPAPRPEPPEEVTAETKAERPQGEKGVKIEADSDKPLTAKQQYALSKQAFKDALTELTAEQQKAQKEAGQNGGGGGSGEEAEGAPGGGLMGLAKELMPLLKMLKDGDKTSAPGGLKQIVESIQGLTELEEVMWRRHQMPYEQGEENALKKVRMIAQLSNQPDVEKAARVVDETRTRTPKVPTVPPKTED